MTEREAAMQTITDEQLQAMSDRELLEVSLELAEESVLRLRAIMQILEALGSNPLMAAMLPPGFKVE
jgi:hypothetical protein